jgi:hypothetical protein
MKVNLYFDETGFADLSVLLIYEPFDIASFMTTWFISSRDRAFNHFKDYLCHYIFKDQILSIYINLSHNI